MGGVRSTAAIRISPRLAHYGAAKAGMLSPVRRIAASTGPYGITSNAVIPSAIKTDINRDDVSRPRVKEAWAAETAVQRVGAPHDVASAIIPSASREARPHQRGRCVRGWRGDCDRLTRTAGRGDATNASLAAE